MQHSRRQFLLSSAALGIYGLLGKGTIAQNNRTRVFLLGTKGGPSITPFMRSNASTVLFINGEVYLVDCGYGTSRQLVAVNGLGKVRHIFITHHHSDHNLEYGPLLYNVWETNVPMNIDAYGPPGLEKMTRDFFSYEKFDIETRIVDEGQKDLRKNVRAHDFHREGIVLKNDSVTVTSCQVKHPPITQSYAYRFDAKGRSVVISGDTTYCPHLAEFAKGADVLIHEAMYLPVIESGVKELGADNPLIKHLLASHTNTKDVGRIAAQAGVKTLVLSHLVPASPGITDEMWTDSVRKHFNGKIIVGKDLMEI